MTGPQDQPTKAPFNSRPLWVLLFFAVGVAELVWGLIEWNGDKVIVGLLFFAVGNLTRTIGVYRQQLGLFP